MITKKFSLGYKIFVWISLFLGIWLNLAKTSSIIALLSYYTLQSNTLCLIAFSSFIIMELRQKEKSDIYYLVKGALIVAIAVTAIVYLVALMPIGFRMEISQNTLAKMLANFLVHILSPLLVISDYFLFDQKGNFKWYYPLIWIVLPSNYVLYVYTYSAIGGKFYNIGGSKKFAYIFLDYTKIGISGVAKCLALICIGILFISYALVLADKNLSKKYKIE